jgi:hypothetical protein
MNDHERKEAAAKLIEAVKHNTNGAYDNWTKVNKDATHEYAQWVQKSIGLAHPPTAEDMEAMHEHSRAALKDDIADMRAARPEGPVCAGACIAED